MCGIWGFVGTDAVPLDAGWDGLCALTDRGPNDWGVYTDVTGKVTDEERLRDGDASVFLGNRRLSILDLSAAGNQPMATDNGSWIVYNGEVYNYQELRRELRNRGHEFASDTDTEVVLRAYEEYGPACVERFRGMFAFAIYDVAAGRLFAARDRFGIKPFYYDRSESALAFASEVTSLLESGVTSPALDQAAVDGFLAFGYVPEPRTIVEDVHALPPASRMTYDRETGELETEAYWTPTVDGCKDGDPERVADLLEESVRLRLRSDVPVGVFLSGGLDSSAVVAAVRAIEAGTDGDLHTFSIGFEENAYSERGFAQQVAAAFGTEHTAETISAATLRNELDAIVDQMDQPSIDGVNTYFVSKVAAAAGLKVALSGLGSDELFYGYPTFRRVERWYPFAKGLHALPGRVRRALAGLLERIGTTGSGSAAERIADGLRTDASFGATYLAARGLFATATRRELHTGPMTDWARAVEEDVRDTVDETAVGNVVSIAELRWYMNNQLLRDTDAMSMAHSLEVRIPFLDRRLAEYVLTVDDEVKAAGEKQLLKEAVGESLPAAVLDREKTGFTFPLAEWLHGPLAAEVDTALDEERLAAASLNPDAVERIRRAFEAGDVHWSRLWSLVVLSLWVDRHLTPSGTDSDRTDR